MLEPIEHRYLLLRAAEGILRHRQVPTFKHERNAYEWLFNLKITEGANTDEISQVLFQCQNSLDLGAEIERLRNLLRRKENAS